MIGIAQHTIIYDNKYYYTVWNISCSFIFENLLLRYYIILCSRRLFADFLTGTMADCHWQFVHSGLEPVKYIIHFPTNSLTGNITSEIFVWTNTRKHKHKQINLTSTKISEQ